MTIINVTKTNTNSLTHYTLLFQFNIQHSVREARY